MQDVVMVHGEEHVILEQRGSIFKPKFTARSLKTGKVNNLKLNQKGLIRYYVDLANQFLFCLGLFSLFIVFLVLFA